MKDAKSEIQGLIEKSKAAESKLAKAKQDLEDYESNEKKLKEKQAENKVKEDEKNKLKVISTCFNHVTSCVLFLTSIFQKQIEDMEKEMKK